MVSITKVPRWGVHNGIKYTPNRSILKICPICNSLFLHYNKGKKVYCNEICSRNGERIKLRKRHQKMLENRDNFELANNRNSLYAQGFTSEKTWTIGTDYTPKFTYNNDGSVNWDEYHKTLKKKKERMGIV